jgi:hypothetical protein
MRNVVSCDSDNLNLNLAYRNGGNLNEDRENGWDCVSQMRLLRRRPDVLANVLRAMGISESGDDMPDEE